MERSPFQLNEQGTISDIKSSLNEILSKKSIGINDTNKVNKNLCTNFGEISGDYIMSILEKCISNNPENIDTEYIEDYFPDCNTEGYIKTYLGLLKGIKSFLINNKISETHQNELCIIFNSIERKKEIKINNLCTILNIIGKYSSHSNESFNIIDQNIVNIVNNNNNDINDNFLIYLLKLGISAE